MRKKLLLLICLSALLIIGTACAPKSQGGKTYSANQAQSAMKSHYGVIIHLSQVQIQHEERGVGTVAGGILGGVIGSTIGSGGGTRIATVGGAMAGAAAGSASERSMNLRSAWEIEVALNDGRNMVIVQENDEYFQVGDHVRVIESRNGTLRVRQ